MPRLPQHQATTGVSTDGSSSIICRNIWKHLHLHNKGIKSWRILRVMKKNLYSTIAITPSNNRSSGTDGCTICRHCNFHTETTTTVRYLVCSHCLLCSLLLLSKPKKFLEYLCHWWWYLLLLFPSNSQKPQRRRWRARRDRKTKRGGIKVLTEEGREKEKKNLPSFGIWNILTFLQQERFFT